jgi:spore coat polysaccharide biosynthesis predicted glycosyltransferase SpsG
VLLLSVEGEGAKAIDLDDPETVFLDLAEIENLRDTLDRIETLGAGVLVVDSYDVPASALARARTPLALILDAAPDSALPAALLTSAIPASSSAWPVCPGTRLLVGPRYALLRDEFAASERPSARRDMRRVLVTTGGTDGNGSILSLTQLVRRALPHVALDIIVGPFFPSAVVTALRALAEAETTSRVDLHCNLKSPRDLMLSADLAVTGGGQTTFELAATGTPAVAVCLAENQRPNLIGLEAAGALVHIGSVDDADIAQRIEHIVSELGASPERREQMSRAGRTAVDGQGARRVADALLQLGR